MERPQVHTQCQQSQALTISPGIFCLSPLKLWGWTISKKLTQLSQMQTHWHFIRYLKVTTNKQNQKVFMPKTTVQLRMHANIYGRIEDLELGTTISQNFIFCCF